MGLKNNEGKPHKHAELIKAWADGAVIQASIRPGVWLDCDVVTWRTDVEYRIKPEPPKPVLSEKYRRLCAKRGDLWSVINIRPYDQHENRRLNFVFGAGNWFWIDEEWQSHEVPAHLGGA